jgi:hypothetical protein
MKNYLENGLEIFDDVFGEIDIFEPVIKWGEYVITEEFGRSKNIDENYYQNCEKAKLILTQPLEVRKKYQKGSFAYGYILNGKQFIYGGQCSGTSRINAPSSVGGFDKTTHEPKIPSESHGKTNVKLFFEVNDLLRKGNKIEIFVVKAKENAKVGKWVVKIDEKQMEKELLTQFENIQKELPLLNNNNDQKYYQF